MKKLFYTLFFCFLTSLTFAQEMRLGGNYGYMFGGGTKLYYDQAYQDIKILASEFGMAYISFAPTRDFHIGFSYTQQNSDVRIRRQLLPENYVALNTRYYNLEFGRLVDVSDLVQPFGSFGVGLVQFKPLDRTLESSERLNMTLTGGLNLLVTERLGIRLQARMLMPVFFAGAGFYLGTGGSGLGLSLGSVMVQGEASGGIFLRLGNE